MGPKPNGSVLGDTFTDLQRWEAQVLVTQVCAHADPTELRSSPCAGPCVQIHPGACGC